MGAQEWAHMRKSDLEKLEAGSSVGFGGGLRFRSTGNGKGKWQIRISTGNGKRVDRGLGGFPDVSIRQAMAKAEPAKGQIEVLGKTPDFGVSFEQAAERFIREQIAPRLSSPRSVASWDQTMRLYALPALGSKSVSKISAQDVVACLEGIWTEKPETARRLLQRLRRIFDYSIAVGWRINASPCTGVENLLPYRKANVSHHKSTPYASAPRIYKILLEDGSESADLIRLAMLTGLRSSEVRLWEFTWTDFKAKLVRIPSQAMKARLEFIQPLSDPAMAIVRDPRWPAFNEVAFSNPRNEKPFSVNFWKPVFNRLGIRNSTLHGFRSSLRSWAAEKSDAPEDVCEAVLAHVPGKLVQAYRRGSMIEKKRALLDSWSRYLEHGY